MNKKEIFSKHFMQKIDDIFWENNLKLSENMWDQLKKLIEDSIHIEESKFTIKNEVLGNCTEKEVEKIIEQIATISKKNIQDSIEEHLACTVKKSSKTFETTVETYTAFFKTDFIKDV